MCKFIYTKFFIKLSNNSMVSSYFDKIQYYTYRSYFFYMIFNISTKNTNRKLKKYL